MSLFRVDGPIYQFVSRFWDMIKLNFVWLLCSIPIVTIGASTAAAYTVTLKMVDEKEGYIVRSFFRAFRANLKKGIPLGLIAMVAVYAVYMDFQLFYAIEERPLLLLIVGICSIFLFTLSLLYAFPLTARYENTVRNTLKNSWEISLKFFGRTVALLLVLALEILIFFFNEWLMLVFVLIGPACLFLTVSGFAMYFFRQIEQDPDTVIRKEEPEDKEQAKKW